MYCFKCGAKIAEDARFCDKCGTPVAGTRDSATEDPGFNTIFLADAMSVIDLIYSTYMNAKLRYEKAKDILSLKNTIIGGGLICFILCIIAVVVVKLKGIENDPNVGLLLLVGPWILFAVMFILRCVYLITLAIRSKTKERQARAMYAEKMVVIDEFPSGYRYPLAADYIFDLITSGRVRTMNEALDKFDQHVHQQSLVSVQSIQKTVMDSLRPR